MGNTLKEQKTERLPTKTQQCYRGILCAKRKQREKPSASQQDQHPSNDLPEISPSTSQSTQTEDIPQLVRLSKTFLFK